MTREELQNNAVKIGIANSMVIFELATGIGKSLIAIRILEQVGGEWNIVLAETNHELNWITEFKKHGKEYLLNRIKFFCYQSLHKYKEGANYIFDEVHHITSVKRLTHLNDVKKANLSRFIGLSATLTISQKELIKSVIGNFANYKVSLSQAIDWGILPEPTVYFMGVNLDNKIKNIKYTFSKDKFIYVTEQDYYDRITAYIGMLKDLYMKTRKEYHRIMWLRKANDRKKFLAERKTPHAKALLEKLKNKRYICFTGSIKQSEQLSDGLSIHSKIPKAKREELINDFNNGDIDKLFATGMLKEGINLNNIEVGIIIQLDNVTRYFQQVHGRTLRSLYPEQYVIYVKNTQDERYIETALEGFNRDYVKFINF